MKSKTILGFDKYKITTDGRVISYNYYNRLVPKELSTTISNTGYVMVGLRDNNKKGHTKLVHRLVAEAFIPNPYNKPHINHIDGDKTNNNISNLEWVTRSENQIHAITTGLVKVPKGEDCYNAKLTNNDAEQVIKLLIDGRTNEEVAILFNLHPRYVSLIRHKKRWKSVWDTKFPNQVANVSTKNNFMYDREALLIDAFFADNTNADIARKFDLDPSIISKLRNNRLTKNDRIIFNKLNTNMCNDHRTQNNTNRYYEKQVEYISSEMEKVGDLH